MTRKILTILLVSVVLAPAAACLCFLLPSDTMACGMEMQASESCCCCGTEMKTADLPEMPVYVTPVTFDPTGLGVMTVEAAVDPVVAEVAPRGFTYDVVTLERGSPPLYVTHHSFLI